MEVDRDIVRCDGHLLNTRSPRNHPEDVDLISIWKTAIQPSQDQSRKFFLNLLINSDFTSNCDSLINEPLWQPFRLPQGNRSISKYHLIDFVRTQNWWTFVVEAILLGPKAISEGLIEHLAAVTDTCSDFELNLAWQTAAIIASRRRNVSSALVAKSLNFSKTKIIGKDFLSVLFLLKSALTQDPNQFATDHLLPPKDLCDFYSASLAESATQDCLEVTKLLLAQLEKVANELKIDDFLGFADVSTHDVFNGVLVRFFNAEVKPSTLQRYLAHLAFEVCQASSYPQVEFLKSFAKEFHPDDELELQGQSPEEALETLSNSSGWQLKALVNFLCSHQNLGKSLANPKIVQFLVSHHDLVLPHCSSLYQEIIATPDNSDALNLFVKVLKDTDSEHCFDIQKRHFARFGLTSLFKSSFFESELKIYMNRLVGSEANGQDHQGSSTLISLLIQDPKATVEALIQELGENKGIIAASAHQIKSISFMLDTNSDWLGQVILDSAKQRSEDDQACLRFVAFASDVITEVPALASSLLKTASEQLMTPNQPQLHLLPMLKMLLTNLPLKHPRHVWILVALASLLSSKISQRNKLEVFDLVESFSTKSGASDLWPIFSHYTSEQYKLLFKPRSLEALQGSSPLEMVPVILSFLKSDWNKFWLLDASKLNEKLKLVAETVLVMDEELLKFLDSSGLSQGFIKALETTTGTWNNEQLLEMLTRLVQLQVHHSKVVQDMEQMIPAVIKMMKPVTDHDFKSISAIILFLPESESKNLVMSYLDKLYSELPSINEQ